MNQTILHDLQRMYDQDQAMRHEHQTNPESWDEELDKRNTARLKEIIAEIGWPTISKVGHEGSMQAWLLAQHADHDVEFQKECLKRMKAESEKEVSRKNMAFLEDRIATSEGRPQPYGTQFKRNAEGKFEPLPIFDPQNVDQRRLEMGLHTLAENRALLDKDYQESVLS